MAILISAVALAGPSAAEGAKPVHHKAAKTTRKTTGKAAPEPVAAAASVPAAPDTGILSRHTIQTAGAYRSYMDRAGRISSAFHDGAQVEESLMTGAQSEAQQFSQGVVAYAAVLALQDPSFVVGVRAYAKDEAGKRELVRHIIENPNFATILPGANSAAAAISAGLAADGARVSGAGALVKQAAYDVQHSAWSKAAIPALPTRLAKAKQLSLETMHAEAADIAAINAILDSVESRAASTPVSTDPMPAPTTQTVSRGLSIAALAVLGAGGLENDAVVQSLMNDPNAGFCMNMAKLNLNQCLSVAKPYYEDVFCLGQHVLIDTGQCVAKGAGQSSAPVVATVAATSYVRPESAPPTSSYAASR